MRLFHRRPAAVEILRDGFRDGCGSHLTEGQHRGVWLSSVPLDANEGAKGDDLLELHLPEDIVADYEWIEPAYREFLVPAEIVNRFGPPRLLTPAEEEGLTDERWSRYAEDSDLPACHRAGDRTGRER